MIKRILLSIFCAALSVSFLSGRVQAASDWFQFHDTKVEYYEIYGSTVEQLRQQMSKKGKEGYFGYTSYRINWKGAKAEVKITVLMPRWKNQGASASMRKKWFDFWNALALHEQGHVDSVWKYVRQTRSTIEENHLSGNEANKRWKQCVADINAEFKEYDAETDHGVTQGAVF